MFDEMIIHETTYQDIYNCARCGKDHLNLVFYRFHNPVIDHDGTRWEWWATCPTNHDPILMRAEKTSAGYFSEEER